jgi:hypothetical protein
LCRLASGTLQQAAHPANFNQQDLHTRTHDVHV